MSRIDEIRNRLQAGYPFEDAMLGDLEFLLSRLDIAVGALSEIEITECWSHTGRLASDALNQILQRTKQGPPFDQITGQESGK
jgi:hypothetical protein